MSATIELITVAKDEEDRPGEVGEVTAAEIVCWLPATDIRPDSICVDVGLGGPCHSPTARASSNRGSRAALSACALMS